MKLLTHKLSLTVIKFLNWYLSKQSTSAHCIKISEYLSELIWFVIGHGFTFLWTCATLITFFLKNVKTSAEIYSYFSALSSHQDPEVFIGAKSHF